jgi:hypothetical protein
MVLRRTLCSDGNPFRLGKPTAENTASQCVKSGKGLTSGSDTRCLSEVTVIDVGRPEIRLLLGGTEEDDTHFISVGDKEVLLAAAIA